MAFKLSSKRSGPTHIGGVKVVTAPLDMGAMAEARNDGTIAISPDIEKSDKPLMERIIKHEMKHMRDMEEGRAAYGDNWMMWDGKIYLRKQIDGVNVIDGPNGRWPEGDANHPWEAEAIAAEDE
tara:strand:+ start:391 stop:762 length:372 start_codon:yes stop_codon:yes gene_type:complete